mmetsp:Transcript_38712/g.34412  ORF Transcript_38712/g.34412 Transcript_38712/m.34412 type:complete len:242 (+) Transcript_38712:2-727(+)
MKPEDAKQSKNAANDEKKSSANTSTEASKPEEKAQEEKEEKMIAEDTEGKKENEKLNIIFKWKDHIDIRLDEDIRIKIVDFGNACWTDKHFTDNIQTREYRSPEAIIGAPYKANTDIWSLACVIFEMLTSNFLFKPKKGEKYSKSDDHLALMIEHLGKPPKNFALSGKYSRDYFNKTGNLIKIKDKDLSETTIAEALIDAGDIEEEEAFKIQDFLMPMLEWDPEKRISAADALKHPWLWEL